jgi:hypothetical protein
MRILRNYGVVCCLRKLRLSFALEDKRGGGVRLHLHLL